MAIDTERKRVASLIDDCGIIFSPDGVIDDVDQVWMLGQYPVALLEVFPGGSSFTPTGPGGSSFAKTGPSSASFSKTGPGGSSISKKTSHN
jgi:hypothetical protein